MGIVNFKISPIFNVTKRTENVLNLWPFRKLGNAILPPSDCVLNMTMFNRFDKLQKSKGWLEKLANLLKGKLN